jgi:hypothetical protein
MVAIAPMSDDRPNPLTDVRKGLGLLFRAARTTISRLPKGDLEEAVVTSAREVGRAIENVATTLEREVLGKIGLSDSPKPPKGDKADPESAKPADPKDPPPEPPPSRE